MKFKNLFTLFLGTLICNSAYSTSTVDVNNIQFSGSDLVFFDNSGNPLTAGTVSIFLVASAGPSPTTFADAQALGTPLLSLDIATNSPGGGFFSAPFTLDNQDGSNSGDVFLLIANSTNDQFAAIDIAEEFGVDTATAPTTALGFLTDPSLITLSDPSSAVGSVDTTAVGSPGNQNAFQLRLAAAAVPEPSSALLLGLSGLGLLARRKR